MKIKQMNKNEKIEFCIGLLLVCIILLTIYFLVSYFYHNKKYINDIQQLEEITSDVFSLDKIILYSSASAQNTSNSSLLSLDISQFTDIAIFIDNHPDGNYTLENTIKKCYINTISFSPLPEQGTAYLYPKDLNTFAKIDNFSEKEAIENSFNFPIVKSKDLVDYSKYEIASTCSTPIVLEYVNQNIKTNYNIPSESNPTLDGSILKKTGVPFSSIETNLSFKIHIINGLDEHFICNVNLAIPLRDNSYPHTIYDGSFTQELNNLDKYTFLKQVD